MLSSLCNDQWVNEFVIIIYSHKTKIIHYPQVRAAHGHMVAGGGDDVTAQRRGPGRRQRTTVRRRGLRRHRLS